MDDVGLQPAVQLDHPVKADQHSHSAGHAIGPVVRCVA